MKPYAIFLLFLLPSLLPAELGDECVPVAHDRIVAQDLVQAIPAFRDLPQDLFFGYAPRPGTPRVFAAKDLRQVAQANGIDAAIENPVCVAWPMHRLTKEDVETAVTKAADMPGLKIEILDFSQFPVPSGDLVFLRPPVNTPHAADEDGLMWRGGIEYAKNRNFTVWAKVRVKRAAGVVVAVAPLRTGEAITAEQVKLEEDAPAPLFAQLPASVDAVVGLVPRRYIAGGSVIETEMLDAPLDVTRGQTVDVDARFGPVHFRLPARALSDGHRGETITVQNIESGRPFEGKIAGPGQIVIRKGETR